LGGFVEPIVAKDDPAIGATAAGESEPEQQAAADEPGDWASRTNAEASARTRTFERIGLTRRWARALSGDQV
jgi:hypothetical protein